MRNNVIFVLIGFLLGAALSAYAVTGVDKEFIFANQLAPNRFTQQNEFAGGINISGGFMQFKTSTNCANDSCTNSGQGCVTGTNFFLCNPATGLYQSVSATSTNSGPATLSMTPQSSLSASCSNGQVVMMTNGAICHCYAQDSWENIGVQGVCQVSTSGGGGTGTPS